MEDKRNIIKQMGDILEYWKKNPGCDPNIAEYFDLCSNMILYLKKEAPDGIVIKENSQSKGITNEDIEKKYPFPKAIYEKFCLLSDKFEEKLLSNELEIGEDSPLYGVYVELRNSVDNYTPLIEVQTLRKVSTISLQIAQKERDVRKGKIDSFTYDDTAEMLDIIKLNEKFEKDKNIDSPIPILVSEIFQKYQKEYTNPLKSR